MTANDILRHCLDGLPDSRIQRLMRHVSKGTSILCGCDQAGAFFVLEGRMDPVMLACYDEPYTDGDVIYAELHEQVKEVYDTVATRVPHSGYANALEELTQWDIRQVIQQLARKRGIT